MAVSHERSNVLRINIVLKGDEYSVLTISWMKVSDGTYM